MATVKQFKDLLEDMKTVYQYKDEATEMATLDVYTRDHNHLTLITTDEATGVKITMERAIKENDR